MEKKNAKREKCRKKKKVEEVSSNVTINKKCINGINSQIFEVSQIEFTKINNMFKRNKLKTIHEKLKENSGSNSEQAPSPGSSE